MWAGIISLLPELFEPFGVHGVSRRSIAAGTLDWSFYNPREFTQRPQGQVDDKPYGGGPGMVMQAQPLLAALRQATAEAPSAPRVILPSPQGRPLDHELVVELAAEPALIFVCGRYEGIDERVVQRVDDEVSVGDYVLTGGELPTLLMLDAISRWLPGTLGNQASAQADSFADGLLEGPHYTRPERLPDGATVPSELMSGDHAKIARYRRIEALKRTLQRRPELLLRADLAPEDIALLQELLGQAQ